MFSVVVKLESFNEVNDAILDSNSFISLLARSWDGFSYCFESFSCGIKAGGSFDFVLVVKTCCCSGSFEEVEKPFGLVVSRVDADVLATKKFYKICNLHNLHIQIRQIIQIVSYKSIRVKPPLVCVKLFTFLF